MPFFTWVGSYFYRFVTTLIFLYSLKVNANHVVEEAVHQRYSAPVIRKALGIMVMKKEVKEYNKGKMIERVR